MVRTRVVHHLLPVCLSASLTVHLNADIYDVRRTDGGGLPLQRGLKLLVWAHKVRWGSGGGCLQTSLLRWEESQI